MKKSGATLNMMNVLKLVCVHTGCELHYIGKEVET